MIKTACKRKIIPLQTDSPFSFKKLPNPAPVPRYITDNMFPSPSSASHDFHAQ